jgi:hypothetical protein
MTSGALTEDLCSAVSPPLSTGIAETPARHHAPLHLHDEHCLPVRRGSSNRLSCVHVSPLSEPDISGENKIALHLFPCKMKLVRVEPYIFSRPGKDVFLPLRIEFSRALIRSFLCHRFLQRCCLSIAVTTSGLKPSLPSS